MSEEYACVQCEDIVGEFDDAVIHVKNNQGHRVTTDTWEYKN